MTDLLANEVVRKYFDNCPCLGCRDVLGFSSKCMAERVLRSMQEPIRKGDKILELSIGQWIEDIAGYNLEADFHPRQLRLPDTFQPWWECPNVTVTCSCGMVIHHPDAATRRHEPQAEAGKCEEGYDCENECDGDPSGCYCTCHKPADPVDEKIIREISNFLWDNSQLKLTHNQIDEKIRAIVEMARKED